MIDEIMQLYKLPDSMHPKARSKCDYVSRRYKLDEEETFTYFEQAKKEGVSFFKVGNDEKDEKKVYIEKSTAEWIIDEVIQAIEKSIQWMLKSYDACPVTKNEYINIKTLSIENHVNFEEVKRKLLNNHTTEFYLNDDGTVELKNKEMIIKMVDELLNNLTWIKLDSNLFKRFLSVKAYCVKKSICDYLMNDNGFNSDAFKSGIANLLSETELLRNEIIKALTENMNYDNYFKKILAGVKR